MIWLESDISDENGFVGRNNDQWKMDIFLVLTIRLTVRLVSKCDVAIVRAVWLLINILMHIEHTCIFDFNRKCHTSTSSLQWKVLLLKQLRSLFQAFC